MLLLTIVASWALSPREAAGLTLRRLTQGNAVPDPVATFETVDPQHSCLDGQRIIFIGPSTSKLDYLALTFFAEYGRWPDEDTVKFGQQGAWSASGPNPLYGPNLEYGMEIKGQATPQPVGGCRASAASHYYWYSNQVLNSHEVCDCYKVGDWQGPVDVNNQTENRVYDNGKTMVAYFQWLGDIVPPRGSFSFWPLQSQPRLPFHQQCPAGQFKGSWDWSMPLQQFITSTVAHFQPTHLVVDAAFWPIDPHNTYLWDGVAQAGLAAVLNTQGKVLWRTTPTRTDQRIPEHSVKVDTLGFLSRGWKLYDASSIIANYRISKKPASEEEIFYDNTHLQPKAQCFLMKSFLDSYVCPVWR